MLLGQNEHPSVRFIYQLSEQEVKPFAEPAAKVIKKHGGKYAKQLEGFADVFALIAGANAIKSTIDAKRSAVYADIERQATAGNTEAVQVANFYRDRAARKQRQPEPTTRRTDTADNGAGVGGNGTGGHHATDLRDILHNPNS